MENKNSCNPIKAGGTFLLVRKKRGNILCRDHDQANLLEEEHNKRLLLCDEDEKCCEEGAALRLNIIIAHSLYPRIFNKHQQKILKEALEMHKEHLYAK
ncbi:MAG: hypothetical protein K2W94_07780 [Alphaproteobacteria bacterium]|nr:hypothetical protein [Alphaproteobacteria bacterium]